MTVSSSVDVAGRRRSPATFSEFHLGRSPRNNGLRYPADPPAVEEIVAVMRAAGDGARSRRLRAARAWLAARVELPVGPLFCVINGRTQGRPWSSAAARADLRRTAVAAGVRRRFAPHQQRLAQ